MTPLMYKGEVEAEGGGDGLQPSEELPDSPCSTVSELLPVSRLESTQCCALPPLLSFLPILSLWSVILEVPASLFVPKSPLHPSLTHKTRDSRAPLVTVLWEVSSSLARLFQQPLSDRSIGPSSSPNHTVDAG